MTTEPFPTGQGGTEPSPDYYDSTGMTMFPANNAPAGTTFTSKIGGTDYDSFPTPNESGTIISYIESSTSDPSAITFSGSNPAVVITATSPSCINTSHKYFMDVFVKGLSAPLVDTAGTFPDATNSPHTVQFSLTSSTHQNPSGTLQLEIVAQ